MTRKLLTFVLAAAVVLGAVRLWAADAPTKSAKELVAQLSDERYKAREDAQKSLVAMGEAALDAVNEGVKSSDPEIKSRCERILAEIQKNLLVSRTESIKKNILWTSLLDSAAVGTPAVAGNLLVITDSQGVLRAMEAATGKEKWRSEEKLGRFASAAPAVDAGAVYQSCGVSSGLASGRFVAAVELATGKNLWQGPDHDEVSPAVLVDGVIYVSARDLNRGQQAGRGTTLLEAIDVKSGKSLWKTDVDLVIERPVVGGGFAFVQSQQFTPPNKQEQKIIAIDLKTHKVAWSIDAPKNALVAMRAEDKTLLLQTASSLVAMEAASGKELWHLVLPDEGARMINGGRIRFAMTINGKAVLPGGGGEREIIVRDGTVYVSGGQRVTAAALKDGAKQWEYELKTPEVKNAGGPNVVGGMGGGQVIINGGARVVINGMVLGGNGRMMGVGGAGSVTVVGQTLCYSESDGLHAVDLRTRQEMWVLPTAGIIGTSVAAGDGVLYFGVASSGAPGDDRVKLPAMYAVKLPKK